MSVKITTKRKGETFKSIRAASNATGISYMTLYMRVRKLGWSINKAIKVPVRAYNSTNDSVAA